MHRITSRTVLTAVTGLALGQLEIDGMCDGKHALKPWGVHRRQKRARFATAEEAAYPYALCAKVASQIAGFANFFPDAPANIKWQNKCPEQQHNKAAMQSG
jgi:hypothetical protein